MKAEKKLPPFCRSHFSMHFLKISLKYVLKVPINIIPRIGSDNGLALIRRQALIWTDKGLGYQCIYAWLCLNELSQVKKRQSESYKFKNLPKFQMFEFWNKIYTWHAFWSCMIRCANMKWIWRVLLKIQSRHHSVHRRTDRGRTDNQTRWNQYTSFSTSLKHWVWKYHKSIILISIFMKEYAQI